MNTFDLQIPPFEESVHDLITNGYGIFAAPAKVTDYIAPIFRDLKKLIAEDDDFKKKWEIHVAINGQLPKKPDRGLVHPKGDGFDKKWTFMYCDELKTWLYQRFALDEIKDYFEFLGNLSQTMLFLEHQSYQILREVDRQLPGFDLYKQAYDARSMHVIRLLEYLYQAGAPQANPMASLHTDQSLLTTQWYESHPGLVVTDYDGNKIEYDYTPGKAIVFFGKKAPVATNNRLQAVEHYVDSRAQENRNSGIYFVHTQHESVEVR